MCFFHQSLFLGKFSCLAVFETDSTKSIIGIVELTILPTRDGVKDIRLNAKQLLIYKVSLKASNGQILEPAFQYGDPMLEVVKEDPNM